MALRLSIIVVAFDMKREIVRTIASLLPPYQLAVTNGDVEIIVVDNNSAEPVRRDWFPADGPVRVVRVEDGGVSPCIAINRGARLARADHLAVLRRVHSPEVTRRRRGDCSRTPRGDHPDRTTHPDTASHRQP